MTTTLVQFPYPPMNIQLIVSCVGRNGRRISPGASSADPGNLENPRSTALLGKLITATLCQDIDNVLVVVTRWYGGVHLYVTHLTTSPYATDGDTPLNSGSDRFKHINQVKGFDQQFKRATDTYTAAGGARCAPTGWFHQAKWQEVGCDHV